MIKIPEALQKKYNLLLMNSNISQDQYGHCKKWLWYCLDFCKKYSHAYADAKSLLLFLEKLQKKKQTPFQQSQAKMAVQLYYSGIERPDSPSRNLISLDKIHEDIKRFEPKTIDEPWRIAVDSIKNEI